MFAVRTLQMVFRAPPSPRAHARMGEQRCALLATAERRRKATQERAAALPTLNCASVLIADLRLETAPSTSAGGIPSAHPAPSFPSAILVQVRQSGIFAELVMPARDTPVSMSMWGRAIIARMRSRSLDSTVALDGTASAV